MKFNILMAKMERVWECQGSGVIGWGHNAYANVSKWMIIHINGPKFEVIAQVSPTPHEYAFYTLWNIQLPKSKAFSVRKRHSQYPHLATWILNPIF